MIITIGGQPGSGKGTVGKLLAAKLGYTYYSMGDIWGETAKKHGMTLNEFHAHLREHPEFDKEIEAYQESLGKHDNTIVDSRLGYYKIPHAFKLFLTVDWDEGARRILGTQREDEKYSSIEDATAQLRERAENERKQYRALYGTDHYDLANYDAVVDTTHRTPDEIVTIVLAKLPSRQ